MELSNREAWTAFHGMILGAIFLLAFTGGLASFWSLRPELATGAGIKERMWRIYAGTTIMAVAAWLTVITGTWKVYVWYRAKPPEGTTGPALEDYPRYFLISDEDTADWHEFGMEWKEHIAWIAPMIATAVAAIAIYYGPRLAHEPRIRTVLMVLFILAFATAAIAGMFGAFITKAAPVT